MAIYGVFKVVDFVVVVKPIVEPIAKEVKDGKITPRTIVRQDTIWLIKTDTIYLSPIGNKQIDAPKILDNSANDVSEQERQKILEKEFRFRQRMKE